MQKFNLNPKLSPAARKYITRLVKKEIKRGKQLIAALGFAYRKAKEKGFKLPSRNKNVKVTRLVKTGRTVPAYQQFKEKIKRQLLKRGHSEAEAEKGAEDIARMYVHHFDERVEGPYKKNDLYTHAPRGDNRNAKIKYSAQYARRAYEFGRDAFHAGRTRVPVHDKAFMQYFSNMPDRAEGHWRSITAMWLFGWDDANLRSSNPGPGRNIERGFYDSSGFHPIRASKDYDEERSWSGALSRERRQIERDARQSIRGSKPKTPLFKTRQRAPLLHSQRGDFAKKMYDARMAKRNPSEAQQIAQTILDQIKALDRWALGAWGARGFTALAEKSPYLGGVYFRVSGAKFKGMVMVQLHGGRDTYDVSFIRGTKTTLKVEDIYAEELMQIIDSKVEGPERYLQAQNPVTFDHVSKIADVVASLARMGSRNPTEQFTADHLNAHLRSGGSVQITTALKSWLYTPKHAGMFIQGRDGLYVRRGKNKDYLGPSDHPYVSIRLGRTKNIRRVKAEMRNVGGLIREKNPMDPPAPLVERLVASIEDQYPLMGPMQREQILRKVLKSRGYGQHAKYDVAFPPSQITFPERKRRRRNSPGLSAAGKEYVSRAMKRAKPKNAKERGKALASAMKRAKQKFGVTKNPGEQTDRSNIIYRKRNPEGSIQTKQVQPTGIVRIYDKVEEIKMSGNRSPGVQRHEKFYHPFKGGSVIDGLPKGTLVKAPDGQKLPIVSNAVLIRSTQKKPLWGKFVTVK